MNTGDDQSNQGKTAWYAMREDGSRLGIRFTLWLLKTFGYRAARVLVYIVSFYFFLVAAHVRRRCMEFQQRALGHSSWLMAYRTLFNFSISIIDRAFVQMGRANHFTMIVHGEEILQRFATEKNRGAIILCSHLGSVEVGPALSTRFGFSIGMLMYEQRSSMLYQEFERINPAVRRNIIEIKPDSFGHIFEARARYERGELVGIMGDRTWKSGATARVPFFGVEKTFPLGAYHIARILKAPIVFMVIVKQGVRVYHCYVEELASEDESLNKSKDLFSQEILKKYVARLEEYCRRFPTHFYNFYDFWSE